MDLANKETNRKIQIFEHAKKSVNIALTCRYYWITRQVFYKWQRSFLKDGIKAWSLKSQVLKDTQTELQVKLKKGTYI